MLRKSPYSRLVAISLTLLFGGVLVSPASAQQIAPKPPTASVDKAFQVDPAQTVLGQVLPALPAVNESGEKIDLLTQTRGWKVVYFWSPNCPCVQSCQRLTIFPLAKAYRDKEVAFYAIASNPSEYVVKTLNDGTQRAFLRLGSDGLSPSYPIVIDIGQKLADTLKARSASQTFLISPTNQVVFVGDSDNVEEMRRKKHIADFKTKDYLAAALKEAFAGKPISTPLSAALGCLIDRPVASSTSTAVPAKKSF